MTQPLYQRIYQSYCNLTKGDQAQLKRCNLKTLATSPAYFRVLKYTGAQDTPQTQRILYLLVDIRIADPDNDADNVPLALIKEGVKEQQIVQIVRSGENSLSYLKRQLVRCKNIQLQSLGELAQFWGDNARRQLLKDFILQQD